jgi:hypothetical protein
MSAREWRAWRVATPDSVMARDRGGGTGRRALRLPRAAEGAGDDGEGPPVPMPPDTREGLASGVDRLAWLELSVEDSAYGQSYV